MKDVVALALNGVPLPESLRTRSTATFLRKAKSDCRFACARQPEVESAGRHDS